MVGDPRRAAGEMLGGDILEIGPGFEPFPVSPGARVRYADRPVPGGRDVNWPELAGLRRGPRADIDTDLDLQGLAGIADGTLDAVIASHVIEHLANPIAALREFQRVLRPAANSAGGAGGQDGSGVSGGASGGGRLALVVPDRTKTFDWVRQPTPLAPVLEKFRQGVTQVDDETIREYCAAIYYQPPVHPPAVRQWHDPQRLDESLMALHRRRTIHVHCWTPEEFAALLVALLFEGSLAWRLLGLYVATPARPQEFGFVLERTASSGRAAAVQFVQDWTRAVRSMDDSNAARIAAFSCALCRDLGPDDRRTAAAALATAATMGG